jgi:hypothetical protein
MKGMSDQHVTDEQVKLSTVECVALGCGQEFHLDLPMFHVEAMASDAGWRITEDGALCPDHNGFNTDPLHESGKAWVVGCWTCGFEEELNEDDAKYEYKEHDCEPDTYLKTPADLAKKEEQNREYQVRRATEKAEEEHQVAMAAASAVAQQKRLEEYANRWLKLRNTVVFWKKEKIR